MRRHPSPCIDARGELLDCCIGMTEADEYAPIAKCPDANPCARAFWSERHQRDETRIGDRVEQLVRRAVDRRFRMRAFAGGREKWAFEVQTKCPRSPRCASTLECREYIGICRVN